MPQNGVQFGFLLTAFRRPFFRSDGPAVVDRIVTIPLVDPTAHNGGGAGRKLASDSFLAGPENKLAIQVFRACLDRQWGEYSPVSLYGPPGCGKSHLARGLAEFWGRHFPTANIVCHSAGEFGQAYTAALRSDRLSRWRRQMSDADLFVLEDIVSLGGKSSVQQELRHLLDALAERGSLVIVTGRTLPMVTRVLAPSLRSRLSAGLAVPLALPARSTRRNLVERFAEVRGLALGERTAQHLADGLSLNVPDLLAAVAALEAASRASGRRIDAEFVKEFLASRGGARQPKVRDIAAVTAKYFGLKVADLKSPVRKQPLVTARSMAMYLARQLTSSSLDQVGAYFGNRDHTTVLHACRRTAELVRKDRALRQAVVELKRLLDAP